MKNFKFYIITTLLWIFIFPITGICGLAFMASGVITLIAGIFNFVLKMFGINLGFVRMFNYDFGNLTELFICVAIGIILYFIGAMLWKLTKQLFNWSKTQKLV
ncbi:hypothetical protein [Fastidiosipila sanguinis]|uniref:Uncharacterized protein n=1 Tax=Fastidiosipila sanguinis TaxID=236753 RepID=A0A2S0KMI6_9FIRM|nr:hypothetical protein [Fastidiosipila sanguinis]AVM42209.1 hypothetical protein C5Q98_02710 [Fastidiosipila sanguinis]